MAGTSPCGYRRRPVFKPRCQDAPKTYFKPPYVGVRGWVGVELDRIGDEALGLHLIEAWRMIAPKSLGTKEGQAASKLPVPAARRRA